MKFLLLIFLLFNFQGYGQVEKSIDSFATLEKGKRDTTFHQNLNDRRRLVMPKITDDFTTNGKIVLRVCVDKNGKVLDANLVREHSIDYTEELIRIARKNAFKYRFSTSDLEKQRGTITYKFKLKNEN